MHRTKELDDTIIKYKDMISACGLNFDPEALMVYSALPLLESQMPIKFINRLTGLKWETVHLKLKYLEQENFVTFDKYYMVYRFTHSLDGLLMDEQFKELGVVRPYHIPEEKISSKTLMSVHGLKERHLKQIKNPIPSKSKFVLGMKKGKQIRAENVSFDSKDISDFFRANTEEFKHWENANPNPNGILYPISMKILEDGVRRLLESNDFQKKKKEDKKKAREAQIQASKTV